MGPDADAIISETYRAEWGRILATLIRMTGDLGLTEKATQKAFTAAITAWRTEGIPEQPRT